MPRVPTLQPAPILAAPRPQIRDQAPDADAFGAGLGQGIESASRTAFGVWRQARQSINDTIVLEADTAASKRELETWRTLEQAKGKEAAPAFEAATKELQRSQDEIMQGLSNPVQREAFRRSSESRLSSFESRGSGHVVREAQRYGQEVSDAHTETGMERVYASRNDWTEAARIAAETIDKRRAYLASQGHPPEEIDRQTGAIRSAATRRVVEGLLDDRNDLAAKRLFDQQGGNLTQDDRKAVAGRLETGNRLSNAARLADGQAAAGASLADGRAAIIAAAGDDIELRDVAIQRFENHKRAAEAAVQDGEHDAYAKAFAMLEDPAKDYASLPSELVQRLDKRPDLKSQLMEFAQRQDRTVSKDDGEAEMVRLTMLAYEDPEAFKKTDPRTLQGKMPKADLLRMTSAIMESREGKPGKALKGITTTEQAIKDAHIDAGIDEKDKPEEALLLRRVIGQRLLAAGISADDPKAPEFIQAQTRKLLVRVALDPSNGARPDTDELRRMQTLLGSLSDDDRSALMAEAGGNIDRAIRLLAERQKADRKKAAAEAKAAEGTFLGSAGADAFMYATPF